MISIGRSVYSILLKCNSITCAVQSVANNILDCIHICSCWLRYRHITWGVTWTQVASGWHYFTSCSSCIYIASDLRCIIPCTQLTIQPFKNFQAIIKIRADADCCIHVSTLLPNQSVNHYQSFAVTRCRIFRLKCTKFNFCSNPLESLQRSPDPSWWGEGYSCPLPKNPPQLSTLRASIA